MFLLKGINPSSSEESVRHVFDKFKSIVGTLLGTFASGFSENKAVA